MSTYVISDVHGQYNAYKKMLNKIRFTKNDFLYVLGDVIDRGPEGLRIIQDIMKRENAELLLGNHECMLLNALQYLRRREAGVEEENIHEADICTMKNQEDFFSARALGTDSGRIYTGIMLNPSR